MLIPIKYHKRTYPEHIIPEIQEVAGHFDIRELSSTGKFSLHTEYSYGKRKLDSNLIKEFPAITTHHKKRVPQLWFSKQWAEEFSDFITALCQENQPVIIEIHPPFSDYTKSIDHFLDIYTRFEETILTKYPDTLLFIENRCGTMYSGGKFLLTTVDDVVELNNSLANRQLKLKITLDFPQLLTSYRGPQHIQEKKMVCLLDGLLPCQESITGIHLWGKKRNKKGRLIAHQGDLNTYFEDKNKKSAFLIWLKKFLSDGKTRYFVPEVNGSDENLHSIIYDLESVDIIFQTNK